MTPNCATLRTVRPIITCALVVLAAAGGCDDGGDATAPAAATLRLTTWNAGLADGFVPYTPERRPLAIAAIAAIDADVVCLQEVWQDADVDAVIDGAAATFPHTYHVATNDDASVGLPPACTPGEAGPLKVCVEAGCSAAPDLADCALSKCGPEFQATSLGCQTCMAANIALTIPEIFQACALGSSQFTFAGRNGLILLSRTPLKQPTMTVLESFLVKRAVISAQVDTPAGALPVLCTHLSAGLAQVKYAGKAASWEAEQAEQVVAVRALVASVADADGRAVVMGDTNSGPAIAPDIDGEAEANYVQLVGSDLVDPWVAQADRTCTWCADNPLTGYPKGGTLIDHVLLRGGAKLATNATATRILDGPIEVEHDGAKVTVRLSDHYGVSVTVTLP